MKIKGKAILTVLLFSLFLSNHSSYALDDDFESGSFNGNWINFGDILWEIDSTGHESSYSVSVSTTSDSETLSVLQTTTIAKEADVLSFYARTETDSNSLNSLFFYIDGVEKLHLQGSTAWAPYEFPLSSGSHILRWEYEGYAPDHQGSVWIDDIRGPDEDIILHNAISYTDRCRETLNRMWIGDIQGPISGLIKDDFTVKVNNIAIPDFDLTTSQPVPVSTSLVLDYSGSLSKADRRNVEAASIAFVKLMDEGDRSAVLKFSSIVQEMISFTDEKTELYNAISETPDNLGPNTALYDAIYQGVEDVSAESDSNRERAVIVFTDGRNNESAVSREDVISGAKQASVAIYTVGLGASVNDGDLRTISESTGGQFFKVDSSIALHLIYSVIRGDISGYYTISIDNEKYPKTKLKGAKIAITTSSEGKMSENLSIGEGCDNTSVLFMSIPAMIRSSQE